MASFRYKTRNMSTPKGKPKVYLCCHPKDSELFECLSEDILKTQNCSVWCCETEGEDHLFDLLEMQLFVMPITTRLLCTKNRALEVELPFAREKHIPVLPIMMEPELYDVFNEKVGKLQYLDRCRVDETAMSYEEKLRRYLSSVLIGDELAEKIRAAFDAYVFLSYRKKDRKYAKELMGLIHKNPFCRDIAIWYDEFLTPGENFNDSIRLAIEKSELFVLAVTPNLVNEENYIMTTEYPMALGAGKPILPAELVATDKESLREKYEDIPECTDAYDEAAMSAALLESVNKLAQKTDRGAPEHNFFIGLAYLDGIDVETDHKRALALIEEAAEEDVAEACEQLVQMYRMGKGVERDYNKAVYWKGRKADLCRQKTVSEPGIISFKEYFWELIGYGDSYSEVGMDSSAAEIFERAMKVAEHIEVKYPYEYSLRNKAVCASRLSAVYKKLGRLSLAAEYIGKDVEISEILAQEGDPIAKYDLSKSYGDLGSIKEEQGELRGALEFYKKSLEISEELWRLTDETDIMEGVALAYSGISDIYKAMGNFEGARDCAESAIELWKNAMKEEKTALRRINLSSTYRDMGLLFLSEGNTGMAREYFEKAYVISDSVVQEIGTVAAGRLNAGNVSRLGDVSRSEGNISLARAYFEKSLSMYRSLAAETDSISILRDVTVCLDDLAGVCISESRYSDARRYSEESLQIRCDIAKKTDMPTHKRDVAVCLGTLGDLDYLEGDMENARSRYRQFIEIASELRETAETFSAEKDLSIVYERMANTYFEEKDLERAREYRLRSLDICKEIFERSGHFSDRMSLAISYVKLGETVLEMGDEVSAFDCYEKSITIFEDSARQADTVDTRTWLAYAYERMGNLYIGRDDPETADIYTKKCYDIRKRSLALTYTEKNINDLSLCCNKLGLINMRLQRLDASKKYYLECVDLEERHLRMNGNEEAKDRLTSACHWLGLIYNEDGDKEKAIGYIEREICLVEEIYKNSNTPENLDSLAETYFAAAQLYFDENRLIYLTKSLEAFEKLHRDYPDEPRYEECVRVCSESVKKTKKALSKKGFFKGLFRK